MHADEQLVYLFFSGIELRLCLPPRENHVSRAGGTTLAHIRMRTEALTTFALRLFLIWQVLSDGSLAGHLNRLILIWLSGGASELIDSD